MKRIIIQTLLLLSFLSFTSAQVLKTQLQLVVLDNIGNIQENAKVTLYESEEDYNNSKPAMASQTTNRKGKTRFIGLKAIDYFIYCEKGKKNNLFHGEKTGVLQKGRINKVNLIISQ